MTLDNSHYNTAALTTKPQALEMKTYFIKYVLSLAGLGNSARCHLLEYSTTLHG